MKEDAKEVGGSSKVEIKDGMPNKGLLEVNSTHASTSTSGLPVASPLSLSFPVSSKHQPSDRLPSISVSVSDQHKEKEKEKETGTGKGKGKQNEQTPVRSTPSRERIRANSTPSKLSLLSTSTPITANHEPQPTTPFTATSNPSSASPFPLASTPLPKSSRLRRTPGTSSFGNNASFSSSSSSEGTRTPTSSSIQRVFSTSALEGGVIPDAALASAVEFLPPIVRDGETSYAEVAARAHQRQRVDSSGRGATATRGEGEPPPYDEAGSTSTDPSSSQAKEQEGFQSRGRPRSTAETSKSRASRGGGHKRGETEGDAAADEAGTRRGELKRFTLWETKTVSPKGLSVVVNRGARWAGLEKSARSRWFQILKVDRTPPVLIDEPNSSGATESQASTSANEPGSSGAAEKERLGEPSHAPTGLAGASGGGSGAQNPSSNLSKPTAGFSASGERYLSSDVSEVAQLCSSTEAMLSRVAAAQSNTVFGGTATSTTNAAATSSTPGDGKDGHGASASTISAPASALLSSVGSGWTGAASRILNPGSFLAAPSTPTASASPSTPNDKNINSANAAAGSSNPTSNPPPPRKSKNNPQDYKWELNVTSDRVIYTRTQVTDLLSLLREGNRSSGGLHEVGRFFGIVGFIRFTSTYYMVLISRRSVVALVGGHYIYHADEAKILPVCHPSVLSSLNSNRTKAQDQEEQRLLHAFGQVDLSKNFYFSYTYDLTQTLQENLTADPLGPSAPPRNTTAWGFAEKFVWNHYLLMPAFGSSVHSRPTRNGHNSQDDDPNSNYGREWVLPLVYGFVDQAKLSVLSRTVHVTLIARRSRHFAGARFLKRGVNERGQVANDVETEQIVAEAATTPFFAPGGRRKNRSNGRKKVKKMRTELDLEGRCIDYVLEPGGSFTEENESGEEEEDDDSTSPYDSSPKFTSYVMHRGSIPLSWTQDSTNMSPRPPIELSVVDPYFTPAAQHFNQMFSRYGTPVLVLNLIKSKEKSPREEKLGKAFAECIQYLNQFLPNDKRIKYIAWDMSRASKSRDQDVIGVLEDIAEETVESTQFFHSGPESHRNTSTTFDDQEDYDSDGSVDSAAASNKPKSKRRIHILLQQGIARVNCVDCLDRTNAAQFVIGKAAFGHQLHALGLLHHPNLPFDCDAVNMLTEMYHDLGDTIALQYGGSHLVNTMETYRKINQWTSHSRDMLEGLKRYYSNSFVDADKQMAINLFLGIRADAPDISPDTPLLEEDDSQEVETSLVKRNGNERPHYCRWYVPANLNPRGSLKEREKRLREVVNNDAGFWAEYYRPRLFTDLMRHHAFKMTAVHQHSPAITSAYSGSSQASSNQSSFGLPSASSSGFSSIASSSNATSAPTGSELAEISPFQARYGPGQHPPAPRRNAQSRIGRSGSSSSRILTTNADSLSSSMVSGSAAFNAPPRAIIGGVRRWMSLNRPGSSGASNSEATAAGTSQLRKKSKRYDELSTAGGGGGGTSTRTGEPTNANPGSTNLVASGDLVRKLLCPEVSIGEAREYQWYSSQFAPDEHESSLTESGVEGNPLGPQPRSTCGGTGARGVSLTAAGAWATSTEGVSEVDLAMYEGGVGLASGDLEKVKELVETEDLFDPAASAIYANAVDVRKFASNTVDQKGMSQEARYAKWLNRSWAD